MECRKHGHGQNIECMECALLAIEIWSGADMYRTKKTSADTRTQAWCINSRARAALGLPNLASSHFKLDDDQ